ncbi:hypothetical protein KKG05_07635 [bacterium]|nr:hypothetical protein [bacterium]
MKKPSINYLGLLLCLIPLQFVLCSCGHEQTGLPSAVFKHWVHSYEDDTDSAYVYRPHDYPFPRSRGRNGFEIKETGEFIQYRIAPTDGLDMLTGRWKLKGTDIIIVEFESEEIPSVSLKIISCKDDVLKIQR